MKKLTKVTALVLSAVMLCALLASCSFVLLSGTYTNINGEITEGTGTVYEFKLKEVTVTTYVAGNVVTQYSGEFSVKDDTLTITSAEMFFGSSKNDEGKYTRTFDFEKGDGFVKIDGTSYDKR